MGKEKICISRHLTVSIGLIYLSFGFLKHFSGASPAESLAIITVRELTFGLIPEPASLKMLAFWETAVGLFLILNVFRKIILVCALVHIFCTFLPLFFFPEISFNQNPLGFSLLGQYIFKNVVIATPLVALLRKTSNKESGFC